MRHFSHCCSLNRLLILDNIINTSSAMIYLAFHCLDGCLFISFDFIV